MNIVQYTLAGIDRKDFQDTKHQDVQILKYEYFKILHILLFHVFKSFWQKQMTLIPLFKEKWEKKSRIKLINKEESI